MTERNYEVMDGVKAVTKMWIKGVPVEEGAFEQIRNIANLPFVKRVSIMPDCHQGKGAVIGSAVATKGAVVPALCGVDIGCGMMAQRTTLTKADLPENLAYVRAEIEKRIPHGRTENGGPGDRGAWGKAPKKVQFVWEDKLKEGYEKVITANPAIKPKTDPIAHLGTLGTGNHFVEICLDEEDKVWVMIHSGSRGIGNKIGSFFIEKAQKEMERWHISLPDKDLAYIPHGTDLYNDYMQAVSWAQKYAATNREVMMEAAIAALYDAVGPVACDGEAINCHHNYINTENHFGENLLVTRKGATRAREGDKGIIPGSMGAKSYIVEGLGNKDSLTSCSHGAGRKMSRNAAKKLFTVEDHAKATEGVECRKDAEVLDETPLAYKDVDSVMSAQSDLVKVLHTLKQIICIKG